MKRKMEGFSDLSLLFPYARSRVALVDSPLGNVRP